MASVLTAEGRADLARLEKTVKAGIQTFIEVGSALAEIRERKLFKEVCSTFEAYVQIRFGFTRQQAYQQIAASETAAVLSTRVDTAELTEGALRPLASLPLEQRADAYVEAQEAAKAEGKKKPSATHTTAAVKARRKEKRASSPPKVERGAERKEAPEPTEQSGGGSTGLNGGALLTPEVGAPTGATAPEVGETVPELGTQDESGSVTDRFKSTQEDGAREASESPVNNRLDVPPESLAVREGGAVLVEDCGNVVVDVLDKLPAKLPANPTKRSLLILTDAEEARLTELLRWCQQMIARRRALKEAEAKSSNQSEAAA